MAFKEDLDHIIEQYFSQVIKSLGFNQYYEYFLGLGAIRKFQNPFIKIQLVNDRGIINLDISPAYGEENFWDSELIHAYIILNSKRFTKNERDQILHTRLDFEKQATLLRDNIDTLINIFSKQEYQKTCNNLYKLGEERFNSNF